MADGKRGSHGVPGPREVPGPDRVKQATKFMEKAHNMGMVGEAAMGHVPGPGLTVSAYEKFTGAMFKKMAPPGAMSDPMVKQVMRMRGAGIAAFGLGVTAAGLYHAFKGHGDDHH